MNIRTFSRAVLLLGLLASAAAGTVAHAELPKAVIAVLDYQQILREAAAANDIRRQIEVYRKEYQQEISVEEQKLRQEEQTLKQQRAILSQEAYDKRREEFEQRVIEVQRRVQDRTRQLDQAFNKAMGELQEALIPIVADLTEEEGFNVVVEKSQVLFSATALDITARVIQILNERLPSVEVPKPSG